ncbi:MAG TPA: redoxin family protein [Pirellulaceae bacterium]|nr:redoxin family protein [Pirellulaceae bacterium]
MSFFSPRSSFAPLVAALVLVGFAALLTGCGAEAGPVTAASSEFRPAGEGASETAPDASDVARNTASEDISSDRTQFSPSTANAASNAPKAKQPPAKSGSAASAPPQGDVETLVAFIDKLASQQPQGSSQEEIAADFIRIQMARLDAAKKILALNPDDRTKQGAIKVALEILSIFSQAQVPGADAQRLAFGKLLLNDKNPDTARMGRHIVFGNNVGNMLNRGLKSGDEVVAQVKELLATEGDEVSDPAMALTRQTAQALRDQGFTDDAVAVIDLLVAKLENDPERADEAAALKDQAKIAQADLTGDLLVNVMTGEAGSEEKLIEAVKKLLAEASPSAGIFGEVQQVAYRLEVIGKNDAALKTLELIESAYKDVGEKRIADAVSETLKNARTRIGLIGQPFVVEGLTLDGQPFDWEAYKGKVVLVDFWATWCGPCIEELPNILRNYKDFHDLGFDVVGVNMDTDLEQVKQFLSLQELPWTSVTSQPVIDGSAEEPWLLPMPKKCGVDGIPFLVLVGKDGKVDSLHTRGPRLKTRLTQLLGEPPAPKPVDVPTDPTAPAKPATEKPADEKPAEKPAAEEKPAEQGARVQPALSPVALLVAQALLTADEPATTEKPAEPIPAAEDKSINPYKAKPGLSTAQLIDYIERMFDKPKSIRGREGFTEAVVDACDRILAADPPAKEALQLVAIESKCEALHRKACTGDDACDKDLMEFVTSLKDDQRPRVARQVDFYQRERRVLDAVEGPIEEIPPLLEELKKYYESEKLTARHLRMASSTVGLINRLEDGDQREEHFAAFGGAFAKAGDKELARYGKKLAKKPGAVESDLVGQPLELAGTTAKGADFVWDAYRGKVVLVDFWATWCGPCRREMPGVKAFYEKHVDQGFDVVGVSLDQDQEALAQYLDENQIAWDTLAGDDTQELASKYGVRGIPTMMLVDKDGKVVGVSHSLAALAPLAEKLLGAQAAEGK